MQCIQWLRPVNIAFILPGVEKETHCHPLCNQTTFLSPSRAIYWKQKAGFHTAMVLLHLSVETKHSLETSLNLLQLIKPHKSNIANSSIRYALHLTLDRLIWLLCVWLAHFRWRCNLIFMPGGCWRLSGLLLLAFCFVFLPGAFFLP